MQALKNRTPPDEAPAASSSMAARIQDLLVDAIQFVPPARIDNSIGDWLKSVDMESLPPNEAALLMAQGLALATTLAVFTPSSGGTVAADRLARARPGMDPAVAAAVSAMRKAQFRLVAILGPGQGTAVRLRDIPSGEVVEVHDTLIGADHAGLHLAAWCAPLPEGGFAFAGAVTPLDDAALAVAMGFVRAGRPGLLNPARCAEVVYRHVLRHGTVRVPGVNEMLPGWEAEAEEEGGELDILALEWSKPGAVRDPEDVQFVRSQTSLDSLLALLASAANTREHGHAALSEAYAAIALLQLETVHRRASVGSGSLRVPQVAKALEVAIAAGEAPPGARAIFGALRQRLGTVSAAKPDAELDKLIGRIQALRAKTVAQGCTEHEALAAAEKVAELLDRYGLSLSELDLQQQSCEGLAVETTRKRTGPLDDCVPAAAAFFDCRVWGEKGAGGTLRYVFFGLRADVAAARYLYELIDQAFERETALFRAGETYAAMPSKLRRTATNSFQIGLGRGIVAKLDTLRTERETTLRRSSGRDLVVVKAGLVDAELAALGMNFRTRTRSGGRRVLTEAFNQGHTAGLGFSYTPGVEA